MLRLRFTALAALTVFTLVTFQWELEQVMMWRTMMAANSGSGFLAAANQALSGEAPCTKCKSLSKRRISSESPDVISAVSVSVHDLSLPQSGCLLPPRDINTFSYQATARLWRTRPADRPALPPI